MLRAENIRGGEVIDEIANCGLYIANIWRNIPEITATVPQEIEDYMSEKLGVRYLGEDNGEHDCCFVLGPYDYFYGPAKSLQHGYENFMDYEYMIVNMIARDCIHLDNNAYQHYVADIPYTKMIGCQICESNGGIYRKLQTGDQPKADFLVRPDEVLGVYVYCNLHGLWKAP